jgi:hypothetical protein
MPWPIACGCDACPFETLSNGSEQTLPVLPLPVLLTRVT